MTRLSAAKRGYNARWRKARLAHLSIEPFCRLCKSQGRIVAAAVVDHIVAHRGDEELFWDPDNWQSLCKRCHDSVKQSEERTGKTKGCDSNGLPLDPSHRWNT